jgi:peptidyl-prolyl cis-trans isomerase SurA
MDVTSSRIDTVDRIVAVVGKSAITLSDLVAEVNQRRANGQLELPTDPQEQVKIGQKVLSDLVDENILVQKAGELKLDVSDQEVGIEVDRQIKQVRSHFQSDAEYKTELVKAGFGTPEEYRRSLFDQIKRGMLQRKAFAELRKSAKPANVTEEEVDSAYERARTDLQKRPASITFRQIIVAPRPSKEEDAKARAKAESLLVQLQHGANFEEMAKRESMDDSSAKLGGDLGWTRRGLMVPQFEAMMFAIAPGHLSPVFKTAFGYHILRVDRVQPAEVKVRHILIMPSIDSNDVHQALLRADSVAQLWRAGADFDSLIAKYHDSEAGEEKAILQPYPVDSLPPSYKNALANVAAKQIAAPFPLITGHGKTKYAIVQVLTHTGPGEYSLSEVREGLRQELEAERQARDLLDGLRKQTYVSMRL